MPDGKAGAPAWESVQAELERRITTGVYPVGGRIPALAALVAEFGVSRTPVVRALNELKARGVLVGRSGTGVYVEALPADAPPVPAPARRSLLQRVEDLEAQVAKLLGRTP